MSNSKVAKNYIYNLIYQVIVVIIPLITTPHLARVLGPEGTGLFSFTQTISYAFAILASLGSALYGQREIAYVQNDPNRRTIVFKEIIAFRMFTVALGTIVYLSVLCTNGEKKLMFLILSIEVFASAFDVSWFFMGIQDFKKVVARNVFFRITFMSLIFIFVKNENDVPVYAFCYAAPILVSNLSLWFYLPKFLTKANPQKLITFKHFVPLLLLYIPQIATEVYTFLDRTMLGLISTTVEVGYYEQADKIVRIAVRIITAMGLVMLPRMAELFASGQKEQIQRNVGNSLRFVFMLAVPLIFGIIGISSKVIPWFYGSKFEAQKMYYLLSTISFIILMIGISNVLGRQYLLPTKQQKVYTISVVTGAVVSFCLNMLFIRLWGALGACISSIIAEATVVGVQMFAVRKQLTLWKYIKTGFVYIPIGLVMMAAVYVAGMVTRTGILGSFIQILIGIIVYGSGLLIVRDPFAKRAIDTFRKKLLNRGV